VLFRGQPQIAEETDKLAACLLILRKQRPAARRDQVLLVYAARHYRELSAQNERARRT
jgi:type I restriction-modification system DNA methylase subunit